MLFRLIDKILGIPPFMEEPPFERVQPEVIPDDVPLDQTTAPIHFEGDITSV